MTHLRKMMLEELQRRNYSDSTARGYLSAVAAFAKHFGNSPDQLGPDELRRYQAYLLKRRKLAVGTVIARVAALRFFFVRTLKRHEYRQDLPYPKKHLSKPKTIYTEDVTEPLRRQHWVVYAKSASADLCKRCAISAATRTALPSRIIAC